ncbi:MAG: hypothetical protein ACHQK9_17930 [Reyranellales bacterium]
MRAIIVVALSLLAPGALAQTGAWSDVECAQSDIVLNKYTKCQRQAPYAGDEGRGEFHSQIATYRSLSEFVYVYLLKPRITFYSASVKIDPEVRERFLARPVPNNSGKTSDFSETIRLSNGHAKTFLYSPDWKCFSFSKDAPLRGVGAAYFLVGFACGKTPAWHTSEAMTAFIQKVDVK